MLSKQNVIKSTSISTSLLYIICSEKKTRRKDTIWSVFKNDPCMPKHMCFSMLGKKYTEYFFQQLNFSLNDFNMWTTYPVETDSN